MSAATDAIELCESPTRTRWTAWRARHPPGFEVAFHGEYREIVEDARLASTEVFEGAPEAPAVSTVTFDDEGGGTTLRILVKHLSHANRDMHLQSGMEAGLQNAFDLLEGIAAA